MIKKIRKRAAEERGVREWKRIGKEVEKMREWVSKNEKLNVEEDHFAAYCSLKIVHRCYHIATFLLLKLTISCELLARSTCLVAAGSA